jgi:hypothetical protein
MGPKELDVALGVILDMNGISFYEVLKRLMMNTVREKVGSEQLAVESDALTANEDNT